MAIVLDVSVVLKWFVEDESSAEADALLERVKAEGAIVPALFRWEAQNALARAVLAQRLTAELMDRAFEDLMALPIAVDDSGARLLLGSEARLALTYGLTAYDAAYLGVALDHDAPLATSDAELAHAAKSADIELIRL